MTQKFLVLAIAAATIAVTSLAVTSSAEARAHYHFFGRDGAYGSVAWYAPRYGYAAPHRYYDRFGSNLNPDRQMVGVGE